MLQKWLRHEHKSKSGEHGWRAQVKLELRTTKEAGLRLPGIRCGRLNHCGDPAGDRAFTRLQVISARREGE